MTCVFDWNYGRKLRRAGRRRKLHDSQLLRHLWGLRTRNVFLVLRGDGTKGGGSPVCGVFGKSGEIYALGVLQGRGGSLLYISHLT